MNPPEFSSSTDPMVALEWVKALKAMLDYLHFSDANRVSCIVFLLTHTAMKVTVDFHTLKCTYF